MFDLPIQPNWGPRKSVPCKAQLVQITSARPWQNFWQRTPLLTLKITSYSLPEGVEEVPPTTVLVFDTDGSFANAAIGGEFAVQMGYASPMQQHWGRLRPYVTQSVSLV